MEEALEMRAEAIMEECLDIADRATEATVATAALRIKARQFAIAKILPSRFGRTGCYTEGEALAN
jgi:Bacteriophage Sf6, terminase small subunit-like